ncbi:MAG: transketolase [Alphaproteobacteria bacterium]|nr:transketolase [Alphaproteobacteria bacterium]
MNAGLQLSHLSSSFAPEDEFVPRLESCARNIRRVSVAAIFHATSGHPGGSLSCADLLAALYGSELKLNPDELLSPDRNRFVLSKGHAAPALYATWSTFGLIEPQVALTLRKLNSRAQGHPHVVDMPLAETSTGSLGQGFSVAIGMALGLRHQRNEARVYTILGDGELQEGEVWEGAMCAAHHKLSNLCAIVDYNKLQSDDRNAAIMGLEPLAQKWRAFGWNTLEISGHDIASIIAAFGEARGAGNRPTVVIAHTVKGKGVAYMEDQPLWHGSVKLTREQAETALLSLGTPVAQIKELLDVSR